MVEDGKGKSPYDPRHNAASVLVGELSSFTTFYLKTGLHHKVGSLLIRYGSSQIKLILREKCAIGDM